MTEVFGLYQGLANLYNKRHFLQGKEIKVGTEKYF